MRVLATNFGPVSSASAPSIRGFFQQAAQTVSFTSASNPRLPGPTQRSNTTTDGHAGCLLPAPDLAKPPPAQPRNHVVLAASGGNKVEEAEQVMSHTQPLDSVISPAEEQTHVVRAQASRQPAEADIDLSDISVAEQASILAGIQRRAASCSAAAPSSKASGKRSRQGNSALQGQEAQSVLQQPEMKQRRISDVFRRVQHPKGGQHTQ